MKTVVDTNIFYYLGEGKLSPQDFISLNLAPHYNCIYEVATSENLYRNNKLIKKAIQQMIFFSRSVIYANPFVYPLTLYYPEINADYTPRIEQLRNFLMSVANGSLPDELYESPELKSWIEGENNHIDEWASSINNFKLQLRKSYSKMTSQEKIKYRRFDLTPSIIKTVFTDWIEFLNDGRKDIDKINYGHFELYIETTKCFFSNLETTDMIYDKNDFFDMTNLIYVQPGDLYFTNEKRWINLIKEAGMAHYLVIDEPMKPDGQNGIYIPKITSQAQTIIDKWNLNSKLQKEKYQTPPMRRR